MAAHSMSVMRLASGRWRAQVYDPAVRHNVSVSKILGGPGTFRTKKEAKAAREQARVHLGAIRHDVTVAQFRQRWLSDPLFARPRSSTNVTNAERTKGFAERYGDLPLVSVDDRVVAEWLAGGRRNHHAPALRAMWNDAMSVRAGRIVDRNPWASLGLRKRRRSAWRLDERSRNRLDEQADLLTPPSFAAYLRFGCLTALRPGELDGLQLDDIDLRAGEIRVRRQWNARVQAFTDPKYGSYTAALVDDARRVMETCPRDHDAPWVFLTTRGTHYTPSSRTHHWNRVRCGAQLGDVRLYEATRHYFAWYGLNVLGLPPHVIAEQLGHRDGGKLIVDTYGHPDAAVARRRIRDAYAHRGNLRHLPIARDSEARP
jgi:integrase